MGRSSDERNVNPTPNRVNAQIHKTFCDSTARFMSPRSNSSAYSPITPCKFAILLASHARMENPPSVVQKPFWNTIIAGVVAVCSLPVQTIHAAPEIATQLDFSSDTTPAARKFYFGTTPGQRYSLWRSTDMRTWEEVAGFPKLADSLSMEHTFAQQ